MRKAACNQPGIGQRHIHYGWVIVLSCILIEGTGQGILLNTFNVFVKPVTDSLGFSRGAFAVYSAISMGLSVLLLPWFGRLLQGKRADLTIRISVVVTALVPLGYSFSQTLTHFYLLAVFAGIFANGVGMMMAGTVVGYWFNEKKGLATGIAFAGSGIMGAVAVPVITSVISACGWRVGYQVVSLAALILYIPAAFFLMKVRPEDCGMQPYGQATEEIGCWESGCSRAEALRMPAMWLFIVAVFLGTISTQAIYGNCLAYFSDLGYGASVIGAAGSLMYAVLALGRVGAGWVFDRAGSFPTVVIISVMLIVAGGLFLEADRSAAIVFAAVTVLGLVSGGVALIPSHWVRTYYGGREFPAIYSVAMVPIQLAAAVGPLSGAFVFDRFGSYKPAWALGAVAAAAAWILFTVSKVLSEKEKNHEKSDFVRKAVGRSEQNG